MKHEAEARAALGRYDLAQAVITPIEVGLINVTFDVRLGDQHVILQRLNPIFSAQVHEDIDAVTAHLDRQALITPRLVRTTDGAKWVEQADGVWRVLTFVEGVTHEQLSDAGRAHEAGALLGRFHRAVADLDHTFQNRRLGVHDTKKHLTFLRTALAQHPNHRLFASVEPLATEVLRRHAALPAIPALPDRIVHGDPKVSNIIYTADGTARCFIDLDTLARMPVVLELGDALRSWCNPAGEDGTQASFSLPLFEAAIGGYAAGSDGLLDGDEIDSIVTATQTILLELAARFLADALVETYFGFDARRFETRGDHNLLRGRRQLEAERALAGVASEARVLARDAFDARSKAH